MKHEAPMSRSEWHGDSTDGIEFRWQGEVLDEVCMYVDGKCIFHLEAINDLCYWMGLYGKTHEAHVNVYSKNNRAHITASAEGWPT